MFVVRHRASGKILAGFHSRADISHLDFAEWEVLTIYAYNWEQKTQTERDAIIKAGSL